MFLDGMEAKTKSGSFLTKTYGPTLDPPTPTRVVVRKIYIFVFDVVPYVVSIIVRYLVFLEI